MPHAPQPTGPGTTEPDVIERRGVRGLGPAALAVATALALVAALLVVGGAGRANAMDEAAYRRAHVAEVQRTYSAGVVSSRDGAVHRPDGLDVPGLLDAVADRADPRTFAAAAVVAAERAGLTAAATSSSSGAPGADGATSFQQTPFPQPTVGYGPGIYGGCCGSPTVVVGDLTGDGLADVVRWDVEEPDAVGGGGEASEGEGADEPAAPRVTATISAVRGVDGEPVWTTARGDLLPWTGVVLQPVGDLTADGTADLLVSIQRFDEVPTGGCGSTSCSHSERFTWDVELLEGRDGTTVWRTSYEGSSTYSEDFDPPGFSYESSTTNAFIPLQPLGDLTGDGRGEVLATLTTEAGRSTHTVEGSYPDAITETARSSGSASTELQVLDGADGSVVDTITQPEDDAVRSAQVVGDVSGDGFRDLLVTERQLSSSERVCTTEGTQRTCTEEGTRGGLGVSVHHTDDLSVAWEAAFPLELGWATSPGDLDGDGTPDVVVEASTAAEQTVVAALDGQDGEEMWTRVGDSDTGRGGPVAFTPLDADDALDVLLVEVDWRTSSAVTILRVDGATGDLLGESTTAVDVDEGTYAYLTATTAGDADGDGSVDVMIIAEREDPEVGYRIEATVESGRTGEVLVQLPATRGYADYPQPVGDLDGDGGSDAVYTEYPEGGVSETPAPPSPTVTAQPTATAQPGATETAEPAQPDVVTRAVRLRDGSVVWERVGIGEPYGYSPTTGRLTDGPGTDLLLHTYVDVPLGFRPVTLALDGVDGATLWQAPPPPEVRRVAAGERIGTAVAVSAATHDSADTVVLARADRFPDALAGGPLAAALGGPLLLTGSAGLDAQTSAELLRLGAATVILLGGEDALSGQVAADVATLGMAAERIAGGDRYATAAAVADRVAAAAGAALDRVAIAAGGSGDAAEGWTDAILASAYGAGTAVPLVLVAADAVPDATAEVLTRLAPTDYLTLVGDGAAITAETEQQLRDLLDIETIRLASDTPTITSVMVADFALREGADASSVWVATASQFPDALAATAAVGSTGGVLLLVDPDDPNPEVVRRFLRRWFTAVESVTLVGGPAAVPATTEDALSAGFGGPGS